MTTTREYRLMSIKAKVEYHLARMRRVQLTRCPACETMVLVRQLDAHRADRCPGRPWGTLPGGLGSGKPYPGLAGERSRADSLGYSPEKSVATRAMEPGPAGHMPEIAQENTRQPRCPPSVNLASPGCHHDTQPMRKTR